MPVTEASKFLRTWILVPQYSYLISRIDTF